MKIKLIVLFLLLVPIIELFCSCCTCNVITQYENYSHKALFLKNLDNSGEKMIETEALQLNKNAYGIRLCLTRAKNVVTRVKPINSIFIQSAYATYCDCPPEYIYSASDSILSIKIITLHDFDDQHTENSDITDYFKIAHSYSDIEDYVTNIGYNEYDFEVLSGKELKMDLLLMTAPTITNNQQFTIQVVLSDGRILEQQTPEIILI